MSSKTEKDKTKQLQDKCQSVLNSLLRDEDNKYCVDCDSKGRAALNVFYPLFQSVNRILSTDIIL